MKTLKTVNGETLMNTYIPPVEFVVKDFGNYTNPVSGEINKEHHVEYVVLVRQ